MAVIDTIDTFGQVKSKGLCVIDWLSGLHAILATLVCWATRVVSAHMLAWLEQLGPGEFGGGSIPALHLSPPLIEY